MGIADDIKNLGEDIAGSYDMRVKAIGVLVKDTHKMLKDSDASIRRWLATLGENLQRESLIGLRPLSQ